MKHLALAMLAYASVLVKGVEYVPRGNCVDAERKRVWSDTCPRCQEVPGAGVCPAPGTFADFMMLFNHTYVLCFGPGTCPRHRYGYWPREVHRRMTVIDGHDLDRKLARRLGPHLAALLGISSSHASTLERRSIRQAPPWVRTLRHRIIALLSTLTIVDLARAAGRPNVLVLEGDIRPVPKFALNMSDIFGLRSYMRANPWEVIRPSGYFFDFSHYRGRGRTSRCPLQCQCARTTLKRACLVHRSRDIKTRCDVRDTVGFALHATTFPVFHRMRHEVLQTLSEMASSSDSQSTSRSYPINESFGWPQQIFEERVPWFDKWLPARFNSLYILPSIVVQQIRQGDAETSVSFQRHCA